MKYLITETQLDIFLLRRFSMDELEELKDDYNYAMDEEDFEDSFFSIDESDSKQLIIRWVENTLKMNVTDTSGAILSIP